LENYRGYDRKEVKQLEKKTYVYRGVGANKLSVNKPNNVYALFFLRYQNEFLKKLSIIDQDFFGKVIIRKTNTDWQNGV
jgi:DNA-binding transcriptional regulator WhiA